MGWTTWDRQLPMAVPGTAVVFDAREPHPAAGRPALAPLVHADLGRQRQGWG